VSERAEKIVPVAADAAGAGKSIGGRKPAAKKAKE
jgi:hypothetical protein